MTTMSTSPASRNGSRKRPRRSGDERDGAAAHEADANQARASDPSASAWVSANAGTGKTEVLVKRCLRLLLAGLQA